MSHIFPCSPQGGKISQHHLLYRQNYTSEQVLYGQSASLPPGESLATQNYFPLLPVRTVSDGKLAGPGNEANIIPP